MNEMRKLMEASEKLDESVEETAYVIYTPDYGYFQKPGYSTSKLCQANFYTLLKNAERQLTKFPDNAEIWEIRVTEVRQIK